MDAYEEVGGRRVVLNGKMCHEIRHLLLRTPDTVRSADPCYLSETVAPVGYHVARRCWHLVDYFWLNLYQLCADVLGRSRHGWEDNISTDLK